MRLCWICTPTRDGRVSARMAHAVNMLQIAAATGNANGWSFGCELTQGSPNIPRQRNASVAKARAHKAAAVLFIDSDIEFKPEDVLALLERPEGVIGISHQTRARRWTDQPNMSGQFPGEDVKHPEFDPECDLVRAVRATTGFLLVKMWVFDKLVNTGQARQYSSKIDHKLWPHQYSFFMHELRQYRAGPEERAQLNEVGLQEYVSMDGEDWDFAQKCTNAGVDVWVDPLRGVIHYEGSTGFDLDLWTYWVRYRYGQDSEFLKKAFAWRDARLAREQGAAA